MTNLSADAMPADPPARSGRGAGSGRKAAPNGHDGAAIARVPPHSIEAEQVLLGALLLDVQAAWAVVQNAGLEPSHFFTHAHRLIFGVIVAMVATADGAVDTVAVFQRLESEGKALEVGGMPHLDRLAQRVPSGVALEHHARTVVQLAHRRQLLALSDDLARGAFAGDTVGVQQALDALAAAAVDPSMRTGVRRLELQLVASMDDAFEAEDELIEGILGRGALSVLYGDSNSGKTYLALDLAAAVAAGRPWMGRAVEPGLVVYLAAEAPRSVRRRLQAYVRRHGQGGMHRFVVITSPLDFFDSDVDAHAVVQAIRDAEASTGETCVLVVGDTLARLSAGANENAGQDMGVVLRHIDQIREASGAHFMLIHHTGKDQAKGMRGWSGLRAACDTEIEVSVNDTSGERVAEITKQRDLDGKGERIGFRLVPAVLGATKWGKQVTACTVEGTDAPAKALRGRRPSEVEGAVAEYLIGHKTGVKCAELVKHFESRFHRASVYKAVNKLVEVGAAHQAAGMVCIATKVTR